jgi:hypothetical protein
MVYPIGLTVEHETILRGWAFDGGPPVETTVEHYAVIKLNGWLEVARIKLDYFHESEDREDLDEAVATWLKSAR